MLPAPCFIACSGDHAFVCAWLACAPTQDEEVEIRAVASKGKWCVHARPVRVTACPDSPKPTRHHHIHRENSFGTLPDLALDPKLDTFPQIAIKQLKELPVSESARTRALAFADACMCFSLSIMIASYERSHSYCHTRPHSPIINR